MNGLTTRISLLLVLLGFELAPRMAVAEGEGTSPDLLVIVGADGTPEYGKQFRDWAQTWGTVAEAAKANIEYIGRDRASESSDRELCKSAVERLASQPSGPLWIVMIGHGTFTRGVAKFNLRGPDVSAAEFAAWLGDQQRPLVVVNSASSSGPFINQLSAPDRVVISATKSGTEQNFARFGEHFIAALAASDSDLDHDDEVSVLEAFLIASARVRDFYDAKSRIATEHALIDDNGDGKGTPASMFRAARAVAQSADGSELDGVLSSRITLTEPGEQMVFTPAEISLREEIEDQLRAIRLEKDQLGESEYDNQIEPLLLRLAELYREVESRAESKQP